ncbi:MAG: DUF2281 domain-containing protein [Bacteroidota bacterium]
MGVYFYSDVKSAPCVIDPQIHFFRIIGKSHHSKEVIVSSQQAIQLFQSLPAELQQEVIHFMEFLAAKKKGFLKKDEKKAEIKKKREPGLRKGFITYMADDFDAPLEDFKDYM